LISITLVAALASGSLFFAVLFTCAVMSVTVCLNDIGTTTTISNCSIAPGSSITQIGGSGGGSMHLTTDDNGWYNLNGFPIVGVSSNAPIMVEMTQGGAMVNGFPMILVNNRWMYQ
jgi:hypothetical protein